MSWEEKPLSQAALDDEAQHSAFLQKAALDLAAKQPPPHASPPRAPSPPTRSKFVTQRELGRLMERAGRAVREALEPLQKRLQELEQREWLGVWEQGKSYCKNALVTHDGSAWVATRDYPEAKPGGGANSGWRLVVKRGRDAR